MNMKEISVRNQKTAVSLFWHQELTLKEKETLLEKYFKRALGKINFWELYQAVKQLNS